MKYFLFWLILVAGSLALGILISALVAVMVYWVGPVGAVPMALVYFVVLIKVPSVVDWFTDLMGL